MNPDTLHGGLPPANDRMLTTCFLAALFHGIVILGVTFRSTGAEDALEATPLEVVLVNDRAPRADKNPNAHYIAQRTQLGSGNMAAGRTRIPDTSPAADDRAGAPGGSGTAGRQGADSPGDQELLATHAPVVRIVYFASPTATHETAATPEVQRNTPDLGMAANDEGVELRMRGKSKQALWIAADTREADVAVYLDAWRRKIERVGTLNFPDAARRRNLSGTPVLEVTIGADGRLLRTVIKRSSGHAQIDEAAMRILKLAAPYDPFPAALNARHDEIRIAYEWQFLDGASQGSSVLYAEPRADAVAGSPVAPAGPAGPVGHE